MEQIFSAEQIEIPNDLPAIMKAWTKEVIRYQPKDIVAFSFEYFAATSAGTLDAFLADLEANGWKDPEPVATLEVKVVEPQDRKRAIFKKAFDKYDADQSGEIDTQELASLLKDLGWDASEEALALATKHLDGDGNGSIDLEEFLKWTEYAWKEYAMKNDRVKTMRTVERCETLTEDTEE